MGSHSWNKSVFNTKCLLALFAVAALCTACGDDDDDGAAGSGGTAGGGSDAGGQGATDSGATDSGIDTGTQPDEDAGAEGVTISGTVMNSTFGGLAGVRICWYGDTSAPCVTSNESGSYSLTGLTKGEWGAITFEKEGYPKTMWWLIAYDRSSFALIWTDDERDSEIFSEIGETKDASSGHIDIVWMDVEGTSFTLDPGSGSGPYNIDSATGAPLTLFVNVDPGPVRVMATLDGSSCPLYVAKGWNPIPVDIEIFPNTWAIVALSCGG